MRLARTHTLPAENPTLTPTSSTRFLVFDKHADIVAQHQIEYPQYYPEPGCVPPWPPVRGTH